MKMFRKGRPLESNVVGEGPECNRRRRSRGLLRFPKAVAFVILAVVPLMIAVFWSGGSGPVDQLSISTKTPNDWFFQQRAFPYGEIPIDAWRRAQQQALVHRQATRDSMASWTPRGPENIGGRITDIAVDPTDDDIVYAGAAAGGVFKTIDGGAH